MTLIAIDQAMRLAVEHHQAGRLGEAETLYRQVLSQKPDHHEALRLLGALARQVGRPELAVDLIGRAIALNPGGAAAHSNLGNALRDAGRFEKAVAGHQQALRLAPDCADLHFNLGHAYEDNGQLEEAIAAYQTAIRLQPDHSDAWNNLGNAFQARGQLGEAIAAYEEALRLKTDFAAAHNNLGNALFTAGETSKGIAAYHRALQIKPDFADALVNLGHALQSIGKPDEAIAACRDALRINPDHPKALDIMGNCFQNQARLDLAVECYRKAVALEPAAADLHSNLVFTLYGHPAYAAAAILAESRLWDRQHARPLKRHIASHENSAVSDKRLRIGYVSPNFRRHAVGCALLPMLRHHDHEHFEIFCYTAGLRSDAVTDEFRSLADAWRNIAGIPDQQAAEMIRADGIDILVDLASHTAGNRLLLMARKPAPVQATYLGAWNTTGLEAIDYRLSDVFLDPPEADLSCYTEKTIRLPRCIWSWEPDPCAPQVSPLPAASAGFVTFACRNRFAKVSAAALELWGEILADVPCSHLVLCVPAGSIRQEVLETFARRNIAADRIQFQTGEEPWHECLRSYERVDIALDPFPYCGWTTTCDALWMGVPAVSLSGQTAMGRGGRAILSNIGLPELVAETPPQYLEIAVSLANDLPRLGQLRSTLRARMERSPLRDFKGLAREIEAAYRQMWQNWCASATDAVRIL